MNTAGYTTIFARDSGLRSEVCVCISLFNYEQHITEALDSVLHQTLSPLDLVIVDDVSMDASRRIAAKWVVENQNRFNRLNFVSHYRNSGLSAARNTGFSIAQTEYVFVLDADNSLYPRCIGRCLQAITAAKADFAYSIIERFDSVTGSPDALAPLMGVEDWSKSRLQSGNYIDAMALIRKSAWAKVGGYRIMKHGWEDYDLWCKFAESDLQGVRVPEILCRYRVHGTSMLNTTTKANSATVVADMIKHHPWLNLN